MSDNDLNPKGTPASTPERFNFKRHMHEGKPTFTSARMFVRTVFTLASVAGLLIGGVYLLAGGHLPDLRALKATTVEGKYAGQAQEAKSAKDDCQELLASLASSWNSGWGTTRPQGIFTSGFKSVTYTTESKRDVLPEPGETQKHIDDIKLDGFANVSDTLAYGDAYVLQSRTLSGAEWWHDEAPSATSKSRAVLAVTRPLYYSLTFRKSDGRWKIDKAYFLNKGPAFIRTVDDQDPTAKPPATAEIVQYPNGRPPLNVQQTAIDNIASQYANGQIFEEEFAGTCEITTPSGMKLTKDELRSRIAAFRGQMEGCTITATIEGVAQDSESTAVEMVSYRMSFTPRNSKNVYVTGWREKLSYEKESGTGRDWWSITKIERLSSSPILDNYDF